MPDAPALIPLPGGPFHLWPEAVVRGAGFPIADLIELGDPGYAALVDRRLAAGVRLDLVHGRPPRDDELADARTEAERRQGRLLAEVAARPEFQEAVAWQNHAVLRPVVLELARTGEDQPANQYLRRKQSLVARYWARYCAKNDTIGFFGPVCWASLRADGEALVLRPGPQLVRRREVALEGWAVDAVAATLSADPRLRRWMPVRPNPALYFDGTYLFLPQGPPVPLPPPRAAVLAACDGERTAQEVAAAVLERPEHGFTAEDEVLAVLEAFAGRQVVYWDFEQPMVLRAEQGLRRRLSRIGDAELRAEALRAVEELEEGRDGLAAVGSVEELDKALDDLAERFIRLTGAQPTRRAGQTYGGRQLAVMDAARDLDVVIGGPVLAALGPPLSPFLYAARALTHRLAQAHTALFDRAYDEVCAGAGAPVVPAQQVLDACGDALTRPGAPAGARLVDGIVADFVAGWRRVLGLDDDARVVTLDNAQLWARVREEFPDGRPGWPHAHHHSVDLQIAAGSVEAVARGDFTLVLGELHLCWNALDAAALVDLHPEAARLAALNTAGVPQMRIMLVPMKDWPRALPRTATAIPCDQEWLLAVGPYPGGRPERRLCLPELLVERVDGRLVVRSRSGAPQFPLIDLGGFFLAYEIMECFKGVSAGRPHTPRVVVDRLVACREAWTFPAGTLAFARVDDRHVSFAAARRWAAAHGLPRFVFAKLSSEVKPFFVDLTSPVQVGNLATAVRRAVQLFGDAGTLTVSEMLPAPDQTWLSDAAGRRYTSELRLQIVDPTDTEDR